MRSVLRNLDRIAVVVVALNATGACAPLLAPPDHQSRTTHALRQEPHRAAVCVARNVDAYPTKLDARIRPGVDPVLIEVHVSAADPVALVQFSVDGDGSRALVTMPRRDAQLLAAMLARC